jgi:hypothetical protein
MFIFKLLPNTYAVSFTDGEFVVECQQEDGRDTESGVKAIAESAYFAAQKTGHYMPTAGMIEYFTAQEMGVEVDQPEMDWSGDVDY